MISEIVARLDPILIGLSMLACIAVMRLWRNKK